MFISAGLFRADHTGLFSVLLSAQSRTTVHPLHENTLFLLPFLLLQELLSIICTIKAEIKETETPEK